MFDEECVQTQVRGLVVLYLLISACSVHECFGHCHSFVWAVTLFWYAGDGEDQKRWLPVPTLLSGFSGQVGEKNCLVAMLFSLTGSSFVAFDVWNVLSFFNLPNSFLLCRFGSLMCVKRTDSIEMT